MSEKTYTTKQIAQMSGVHPNTVRLYEAWGYISKAERKKNNYRVFHERHLAQMKLARTALPGPYPVAYTLVHGLVMQFAAGETGGALAMACEYLKGVRLEKEQALQALNVLDKWFENKVGDRDRILYRTRLKASEALGLTVDAIRTWERNGLLKIGKDPKRKMAFSEWDVEKILVIRLLRNCGYTIASLYKVFAGDRALPQKPSEMLALTGDNSEISYVTDRYLDFLKEHEQRAGKLIDLITAGGH